MGKWTERRALYNADDEDFDPYMSLDVNEYLISEWPLLSLKQRRGVWKMAQNDEDFDWSSIEEQIDGYVGLVTQEESDNSEDEDEDISYLTDAVSDYIYDYWDEAENDKKIDDLVDLVVAAIDKLVDEHYGIKTEETEETE